MATPWLLYVYLEYLPAQAMPFSLYNILVTVSFFCAIFAECMSVS